MKFRSKYTSDCCRPIIDIFKDADSPVRVAGSIERVNKQNSV
jgi:hypothetical protein